MVPVDVSFVPVGVHLSAQKQLHSGHLIIGCHHQDVVSHLQLGGRKRYNHLAPAPYSRDDEPDMGHLRNLGNRLSAYRLVHYLVLCHEGMVFVSGRTGHEVGRFDKEFPQKNHRKDHSHHA